MRLFFGLPIAPDDALRIANWRDRMLPPLDRPVPVGNLHITLAFLGDVSPERHEALESEAGSIFAAAFDLSVDETGYFAKPGILWIGPTQPPDELLRLQRDVDAGARRVGVRTEQRQYQPHITLARRCRTPPPAGAMPPGFTLTFDRFTLFESVSGRAGVHYQPLAEWPLA